MTLGNIFLLSIIGLSILSLIMLLIGKEIRWMMRGIVILLLFSVSLLTYQFITSDFTNFYVWEYSSKSLPIVYKISGIWAGQEGTYLLWATVVLSAVWRLSEKREERKTIAISLIVGIFLSILTFSMSPFRSIYEMDPSLEPGFVPPDGNGLNPLLQDPWMTVHPPVMFISYGLITIPFACAVVYLLSKDKEWERRSREWTRWTWFFLTLGIALGGYWSYKVLGWGGFWAWDPVETSSLIPWLTLTAFMHASSIYRKRGEFTLASPILAIVSFIFVLYAAFITRSGLWESVHAFAESATGPLLAASIIITTFFLLFLVLKKNKEKERKEESGGIITRTNLFYASLILFAILTFISFFGTTLPLIFKTIMGTETTVPKEFFNLYSYPFVILLLSILGLCTIYKPSEKEKQIKIFLFVLVLSIFLAFIAPNPDYYIISHESEFYWTSNAFIRLLGSVSLLSIIPALLFLFYTAGYKLLKERTYHHLIHIGVGLILIGAIFSTSFDSSYILLYSTDEIGKVKEVGKYEIQLYNVEMGMEEGKWIQRAYINIYSHGRWIGGGYANFIRDERWGDVTYVMIHRGITEDVYVIFQGVGMGKERVYIPITVEIKPFISLLWIGIVFLCAGIFLIMGRD
ncbi:MAG: cytochrome c biogenesis protein CcsA [Candidatus Syntropharchaeia archaeon]